MKIASPINVGSFIYCTSIFPPFSSSGGTSSTTGAVLPAPLMPTPCCFNKAGRTGQSYN